MNSREREEERQKRTEVRKEEREREEGEEKYRRETKKQQNNASLIAYKIATTFKVSCLCAHKKVTVTFEIVTSGLMCPTCPSLRPK